MSDDTKQLVVYGALAFGAVALLGAAIYYGS